MLNLWDYLTGKYIVVWNEFQVKTVFFPVHYDKQSHLKKMWNKTGLDLF